VVCETGSMQCLGVLLSVPSVDCCNTGQRVYCWVPCGQEISVDSCGTCTQQQIWIASCWEPSQTCYCYYYCCCFHCYNCCCHICLTDLVFSEVTPGEVSTKVNLWAAWQMFCRPGAILATQSAGWNNAGKRKHNNSETKLWQLSAHYNHYRCCQWLSASVSKHFSCRPVTSL